MPRKRRLPFSSQEHLDIAVAHLTEARKLIREARRLAKIDPHLQTVMLADADTEVADALRRLYLATMNEDE